MATVQNITVNGKVLLGVVEDGVVSGSTGGVKQYIIARESNTLEEIALNNTPYTETPLTAEQRIQFATEEAKLAEVKKQGLGGLLAEKYASLS